MTSKIAQSRLRRVIGPVAAVALIGAFIVWLRIGLPTTNAKLGARCRAAPESLRVVLHESLPASFGFIAAKDAWVVRSTSAPTWFVSIDGPPPASHVVRNPVDGDDVTYGNPTYLTWSVPAVDGEITGLRSVDKAAKT